MSEPTSNRYVYHYYGHDKDDYGVTTTIDGIAVLNRKIYSMGDYDRLRLSLADEAGLKRLPTITSLNFIGREDET